MHWLKLGLATTFSRRARREKLLALLQATEGRLDILSLPYWTRMRTYQYFLSRDEPVCVCGKLQFRGASVDEVNSRLTSDLDKARSWDVNWTLCESAGGDALERQYVVLTDKMGKDDPLCMRPNATDFKSMLADLSKLMISTHQRLCSDPRDEIYARYGIASRAGEIYPPDYTNLSSKSTPRLRHS